MRKPDWFLLMQEWVEQNHGDRGITLPFLVGAIALKTNNLQPTRDDARAILQEMITKPVSGYSTDIGWWFLLGCTCAGSG